jgi:ABC-type multidrug transport system fused ATPase/permease subunit
MIQSLFGLVAALVIAFIYGWKLAFVVLAGVPLMALAGKKYRYIAMLFHYQITSK